MPHASSYLSSVFVALSCVMFVPCLARSQSDNNPRKAPPSEGSAALPKEAVARLGTLRFRRAGSVTSLAFRPDGKGLLAGGGEGPVELWSVPDGLPISKLKDRWVQRIETSGPRTTIVTGSAFGKVTFWNSKTGKRVVGAEKHDGAVTAMIVARDQEVLYTADDAGSIFAWSLTWRERMAAFPTQGSEITALAVSKDGNTLISVGYDRAIRFWDTKTRKVVRALDPKTQVNCLACSSDDVLYAGGQDGKVRAYGVNSGKAIASWQAHEDIVMDVLVTPQGQVVSSGYDGTVLVWDPKAQKAVRRIQTPPQESSVIALSPDNKFLATGGRTGVIRLWDLATGNEIKKEVGFDGAVKTVAVSPDGSVLVCCDETARLRVWDLKTNTEKHLWPLRGGRAVSLEFSPDGKTLGLVDVSGAVRSWNMQTGKPGRVFATEEVEASRCRFSPDGKTLLAAAASGVLAWDAETGKAADSFKTPSPSLAVAMANDGAMIAAGGEKGIIVWDAKTKTETRAFSVESRTAALAFSPGGELVSGHFDGKIRVWNVATGKLRRELIGHEGAVYALAFSQTGLLLVSGSFDKKVILWELASGEFLADRRGHKGPVYSLAVASKGEVVYSGSEDTTILGWKLEVPTNVQSLPEDQVRRQLTSRWKDLASEDPKTGYRTFQVFLAGRMTTVAFLKSKLGLFPRKTILQFLVDLGDKNYKVRARAMISIRKVGASIRPLLEEYLETTNDLETDSRLRDLLAELESPSALTRAQERCRFLRIVALLETAGTPEAKELLGKIVDSAAEAQVVKAAELALVRLARRKEVE